VTLKEQSESVVLLREWYDHVRKLPRELLPTAAVELLDKTEKFLHRGPDPESHGQRRS